MTAYSQNNEQWRHNPLGSDSPDPNSGNYGTIGMYGCYVTAIADVCSWAGNELNPQQINDICNQNGWFVSGDLIARGDIPALLCSNLAYVDSQVWHEATNMSYFDDASDPNVAYIICIDASAAPGIQTHFTMVWATLGNGDLQIQDSWDGQLKNLSHYGHPATIIQSATKFVKQTVAPPPAPVQEAPVIAPPPPPLYTVAAIEPKKLTVLPNRNKWNLAQPDKASVVANPITNSGDNFSFTAVAILNYNGAGLEGAQYYLDDANTPHGWNTVDCVDYVAPAPLPNGAVPITSPKYAHEIIKQIPGYETMTDAQNKTNPVDVVHPGITYYLRTSQGGMDKLATDSKGANAIWINPSMNVPDPTPVEAAKTTLNDIKKEWENTAVTAAKALVHTPVADNSWKSMTPFVDKNGNRIGLEFKVVKPYQVTDLEARTATTVSLQLGQTMLMAGTFKKDGIKYYRPKQAAENGRWWGIPFVDKHGDSIIEEDTVLTFFEPDPDFITTPTRKINLASDLGSAKASVELFERELKKGYKNIIDGIFRTRRH